MRVAIVLVEGTLVIQEISINKDEVTYPTCHKKKYIYNIPLFFFLMVTVGRVRTLVELQGSGQFLLYLV